MKYKRFSIEYMKTKEYKISCIRDFPSEHRNLFEIPATEMIDLAKFSIDNSEKKKMLLLSTEFDESNPEIDKIKDDIDIQIRNLGFDIDETNEYMYAFNEMRIIYLYKHLENGIKSLIDISYPNSIGKAFHHWDNIQVFFKEKGIRLSDLDGFAEVNQLRKLSNALKHSSANDDVWKIPEFVKPYNFYGSYNMNSFYKRVKPKIDSFQKELCEAIIKELFVFDDNKLNELADEYYGRMDKDTAQIFSNKLLDKWNNIDSK